MPIIKSAKKALKQSLKKQLRNQHFKNQYTNARKNFEKAIKEQNIEEAKEIFYNKKEEKEVILKWWKKEKKLVNAKSWLQSIIDKLEKKNIIHKNNSSRKKANFSAMIKNLETSLKSS